MVSHALNPLRLSLFALKGLLSNRFIKVFLLLTSLMRSWRNWCKMQSVLCHLDLEPRNVLVRWDNGRWDLAAIVDWESAAWYPFAFEYARKDAMFGTEEVDFQRYELFKERMGRLVPRDKGTEKLAEALWVVNEGNDRRMGGGGLVRQEGMLGMVERKLWVAREGGVRDGEVGSKLK
jgi:hypothetical protein